MGNRYPGYPYALVSMPRPGHREIRFRPAATREMGRPHATMQAKEDASHV